MVGANHAPLWSSDAIYSEPVRLSVRNGAHTRLSVPRSLAAWRRVSFSKPGARHH